ncbi:MAG: hypothetical protein DRP00_03970 [Candidatus Aenigmatarchaeota archaeon]|nr:MAG: hypothetical protein DRP00_03970 [Candidatus Aenigmarchaeota archaeon]
MAMRGYYGEKRRINEMRKAGWIGFRLTGTVGDLSYGADVVFLRRNPFNGEIEVRIEQIKFTSKDVYYFDKRARSEWKRLRKLSEKLKIPCYFVVYFKNKGKVVLKVNGEPPKSVRL